MQSFGEFGRPRLADGSPPIPRDRVGPQRNAAVFVDTGSVLAASYRLPLMVCSQLNALEVCWSPYVVAELARVATREYVRDALTGARKQGTERGEVSTFVASAMEAVRGTLDANIEQLEQLWITPRADALASLSNLGWHTQDPKDVPVFRAAVAVGAGYLLSRDHAAFPHGRLVGQLEFWHPDTFLTALFQADPELYIDVRLDLADLEDSISPLPPLLPRRQSR